LRNMASTKWAVLVMSASVRAICQMFVDIQLGCPACVGTRRAEAGSGSFRELPTAKVMCESLEGPLVSSSPAGHSARLLVGLSPRGEEIEKCDGPPFLVGASSPNSAGLRRRGLTSARSSNWRPREDDACAAASAVPRCAVCTQLLLRWLSSPSRSSPRARRPRPTRPTLRGVLGELCSREDRVAVLRCRASSDTSLVLFSLGLVDPTDEAASSNPMPTSWCTILALKLRVPCDIGFALDLD